MKNKNKKILIQAWTVHRSENKLYLPYTHWVYLNEIVKYYEEVCLLSQIKNDDDVIEDGLHSISSFKNVTVIKIPYYDGYIGAIKHFLNYLLVYKKLNHFDVFYARYPTPFGWLQKVFTKSSKRIIHFVGDPIDAARNNPNFSKLKKSLLISFFYPEHLMYMWACRGALVYTNGNHIVNRLKKYGIDANPVTSTTLNNKDFYFDENRIFSKESIKLLYVGYLRKAKGVETVLRAFGILNEKFPQAELSIVGSGKFETELKQMIKSKNLKNVNFYGHIDKRDKLNQIFRNHHIFTFASLSEGSPRVVLEAMANGINVVSTPVGSLPFDFEDNKNIMFADFNDEHDFANKIESLILDQKKAKKIRINAFKKVKGFTIQNFIKNIFDET